MNIKGDSHFKLYYTAAIAKAFTIAKRNIVAIIEFKS